MVNGKVSLQTIDHFAGLQKELMALSQKDVLVGIPEEEATREKSDDINNAELLYIHTHGSPIMAVPARPVIEPAIEENKELIADPLGKATRAMLDHNIALAESELNRAGMVAEGAAQDWFENPKNGWPDNAESTIKRKGSDQPLVDTNEMRKSITYVVRDK